MVNWRSKKLGDLLLFANGVAVAIIVNFLATDYFFRIDLTDEKRYTIKPQTKELLASLEEDVYIEVFLDGDLNAGFRRFRKSIEETLEEFRIYSDNRVKISFTDPSAATGENARNEFMQDLANRGIQPTNVVDTKNGERVEKLIFPGALVSYGGFETGVMLLKGNKAATSEEIINQSVEGVEFEIANAIYKLANVDRKRVGLVKGHGELDSLRIASLVDELSELYDVDAATLTGESSIEKYDVLLVAKPTSAYSEIEKLHLDQFIMRGGRAMFFVDKLEASMDSATLPTSFAFPYRTELDDLLFRYGARINLDLVQDQHSGLYPVITGQVGGKPQVQMLNWPFFPLINNYPDHPITRNLDAVLTRFVSSIDTVKAPGIRKTPILYTSPYARVLGAPVNISVNQLRELKPQDFSTPKIPIAYLLEGSFTSLYKNRFLPEGSNTSAFVAEGKPTKILVVADGDVLKNEINPRTRQPQALGFDAYTNYTFANRDFVLNALAYLTEEDGLIQARNKQIRIRPLDKAKVRSERMKFQLLNLVVPLVLLIAYGILRSVLRKRKYASFQS
jgi:ABC-2 type transport system permease protein